MPKTKLKCPYPYFGGKSRVAALVWDRLGDVDNYCEPFAGSAAVLLTRPHPPRIETLNDIDCYVSNFWRATRFAPEKVVEWCDLPVNEADLHSIHRWLVLGKDAERFRARMRQDPDFFDAKVAGRWCFGLCAWIGGGWCQTPESAEWNQVPDITSSKSGTGNQGVHGSDKRGPAGGSGERSPRLTSDDGINSGNRPQLADAFSLGRGVHAGPLSQQMPGNYGTGHRWGQGVNALGESVPAAPGTCDQRRAWLLDWFSRLRDRLRTVRVCCGHWLRVCDSESVTTRLGTTGIFLDPPYPTHGADGEESRSGGLYATDGGKDELDALRDEVLAYCLERGSNPKMRIAVCGYDTDGYAELEKHGWQVVAWKAQGGYGNRSEKGKANAGRERIWLSPNCKNERSLFDEVASENQS